MAQNAEGDYDARQCATAGHTSRTRRSCLWISGSVLLGVALIEWRQPDALAAVTAIPPWCWLIACVLLGSLGFAVATRQEKVAVLAVLLAFLCVSIEQTRSLTRSAGDLFFNRTAIAPSLRIRAVTLNCSGGNRSAAAEILRLEPDVAFLQESPNEQAVQELGQTLFGNAGSVVWSPDCSIIARGQLQPANATSQHFVQATWTPTDGRVMEVICLRLSPPVVRYDLWSPGCWQEHATSRRKHRAEAREVAIALSSASGGRPILIGGDCNAPAGDGALQEWSPRLVDAFGIAGRGLGATVLNSIPVMRFDQLWCSNELVPTSVRAVSNDHSDHRLVVADFTLSPGVQ